MTKANIAQWDTTAANNEDINDISLAENVMKPPAVNNAFRETMAQIAQWTGEGTIASAATCDIGAEDEEFLNVTGTTTITSFGTVRAGTKRVLLFAGALTLTHNATSLILPGGANITTAAGDTAVFVSEGSGNWRCVGYQRAVVPPVDFIVTPWVAYTPTFTSFGAVTGISMWSRRVGDTLHVRGHFTTGTCAGDEARMTIGFNGTSGNVSADAAKVDSAQLAGSAVQGFAISSILYVLTNSSLAYVTFGAQSSTRDSLTNAAANAVFADATKYSLMAEIPISGW